MGGVGAWEEVKLSHRRDAEGAKKRICHGLSLTESFLTGCAGLTRYNPAYPVHPVQ